MRLLPSEAGARRRLLLMIAALVVIGVLYEMYGGSPQYVIPQTTGPAATSKPQAGRGTTASQRKTGPVAPQKLHLEEMEYVPDEPEAGRDLFRFGMHPTPKPTPTPTPVYTPPPTPTAPPPPPPPKVPLFLTTVLTAPDGSRRAYVRDKNGNTFEGVEGDTIDGRYKLVRIGDTSVIMTFVDGTGQTVIYR
jgi:hypothetical protein